MTSTLTGEHKRLENLLRRLAENRRNVSAT